VLRAHLVSFHPSLTISHFSKDSWFYLVVNDIKNQDMGLHVLMAAGMSLLRGHLSWRRKEIHLWILTYMYAHIYKYFYMQPLHLYKGKHGFLMISPILIHYLMDHSTLLLLLIYKFSLQQWETWLAPPSIRLLNFSTPIYLYRSTWFVVCLPVENNCVDWSIVLMFSSFCLLSYRLHSFPRLF